MAGDNFRAAEQMEGADALLAALKKKGRPLASFHKGDTVRFANKMSRGSYVLTEEPGQGFAADFKPAATPGEILALGAFGGRYLNDCVDEFPAEWFWRAALLEKLAPGAPVGGKMEINAFQIDSRLPLSEWRKAGWVATRKAGWVATRKAGWVATRKAGWISEATTHRVAGRQTRRARGSRSLLADPSKNPDERGWFQWYCRYWMGRRIPDLDAVQIQRWRAFARHAGGVHGACKKGDLGCRPRQRQALLHWAWIYWT
jgi:hypothetical protein